MEWNRDTIKMRGAKDMKQILHLLKEREYDLVYSILKEEGYDYTIDNFKKDFGKINSIELFCYLVYLLSNDCSVKNTLFFCDFLMYTDTFFVIFTL